MPGMLHECENLMAFVSLQFRVTVFRIVDNISMSYFLFLDGEDNVDVATTVTLALVGLTTSYSAT